MTGKLARDMTVAGETRDRRLNAEVNKALNTDMNAKLVQQGLLLTPGTIDSFVAFQKDAISRAAKIIAEGKIRAE